MKKTQANINPFKRNKLLMEAFNKITSTQLEQVQTRRELANLLGYTEKTYPAGYSFISRLIQRGYLVEDFISMDENNKRINKYSFAVKDFRYKKDSNDISLKEKSASRELNIPRNLSAPEKIIVKASSFEIIVENPSSSTLHTIIEAFK